MPPEVAEGAPDMDELDRYAHEQWEVSVCVSKAGRQQQQLEARKEGR